MAKDFEIIKYNFMKLVLPFINDTQQILPNE